MMPRRPPSQPFDPKHPPAFIRLPKPAPKPVRQKPFRDVQPERPRRPVREIPKRLSGREILKMTICIAAIADCENCIVTVSDQRLFYFEDMAASDRVVRKIQKLWGDWHVLWAGNVSHASAIISEAKHRLYPFDKKLMLDVVQRIMSESYHFVRSQQAFDRHIAQFGYKSLEEFRRKGAEEFGPEVFGKWLEKIDDFDLGVQLLVVGYDDPVYVETADFLRPRHILTVENPGTVENRDIAGFDVIGSGSVPALNALSVPEGIRSSYIADVVYLLCEAKFLAEGVHGIGNATTVEVFGPNGKSVNLQQTDVEQMRALWKERQREYVPDQVSEILRDKFKEIDPFPREVVDIPKIPF
jgi:hypothetical protein